MDLTVNRLIKLTLIIALAVGAVKLTIMANKHHASVKVPLEAKQCAKGDIW